MKNILIMVVLAAMAGGLVWWLNRPEIPQVTAAILDSGPVESLVANTRAGTVRSCQRSKLSLSTGGTVAALHVKNGDRVEKGQLLMELWNLDQHARREQAAAQLDATRLAVKEICDAAARDRRESKRAEALARKKVISEDALDAAITRADVSEHSCTRAKIEVRAAKAQLELQSALLDQTRLVAPFAGVVAEINGEVGEFVTPSPPGIPTPPAVDLIDDSCLYVRAPIDEVDAADIRVGMPARIALDAFRGKSFNAVVTRIAPYVQDYEKQARTVDVEAEFRPVPKDVTLLVGYSADVEIILQQRENVLRVPTEAIFDQNQLLVLNADNVLEQRTIVTGLSNWSWTEITDGASAGERVLLSLDTPGAEAGARVVVAP